jgi:3-phenylpropionate/trans-cinnamate dioxygenase ferredoxin subunit
VSWVTIATPEQIPPGQVRVFQLGEERIAVCNVDGEFYTIDDECTHDHGPLDQGFLDGRQIECPRHGARFDVTTGKVVALPAVRPVRTYPTRVSNGSVEVEIQ